MSVVHIHWRESDGEIVIVETGTVPASRPGLVLTTVEAGDGCHIIPSPVLHKMDRDTHELVDKTLEERVLASLPLPMEVHGAIYGELKATDGRAAADRPLADEVRASWTVYRQALRDLSKPHDADLPTQRPTVVEIIRAWPMRPDGTDPIPNIRERVAGI
jgi:hypothetical protein